MVFFFNWTFFFLSRFSSQSIIYLLTYLTHLRIYLCIYVSMRSSPCTGFLQVQQVGITLWGCSAAVGRGPLSAAAPLVAERGLGGFFSSGSQASLPCGASPDQGLTLCPLLGGRFWTAGPPGKPRRAQCRRAGGEQWECPPSPSASHPVPSLVSRCVLWDNFCVFTNDYICSFGFSFYRHNILWFGPCSFHLVSSWSLLPNTEGRIVWSCH